MIFLKIKYNFNFWKKILNLKQIIFYVLFYKSYLFRKNKNFEIFLKKILKLKFRVGEIECLGINKEIIQIY